MKILNWLGVIFDGCTRKNNAGSRLYRDYLPCCRRRGRNGEIYHVVILRGN